MSSDPYFPIAAAGLHVLLWAAVLRRERFGGNAVAERSDGRESVNPFHELLDHSLDAIVVARADRILYANQAALDLFEAPDFATLATRRPIDLADPGFAASIPGLRARSIDVGLHSGFGPSRHLTLTGRVLETMTALDRVNWDGEPARMISVRDVTAENAARRALQESEQRYRDLVESSPDGIHVHREGKFVYMNRAARALLGFGDSGDYVGRDIMEFVHPESRSSVAGRKDVILTQQSAVGYERQRRLRADGTDFLADVTGVPVVWDGMPSALIITRDASQRIAAEQERQQYEERYRNMLDWSPDAML
ncbi:MAG: PAS domain S-box protein, partial [Rhodospirillaceae bacterium]